MQGRWRPHRCLRLYLPSIKTSSARISPPNTRRCPAFLLPVTRIPPCQPLEATVCSIRSADRSVDRRLKCGDIRGGLGRGAPPGAASTSTSCSAYRDATRLTDAGGRVVPCSWTNWRRDRCSRRHSSLRALRGFRRIGTRTSLVVRRMRRTQYVNWHQVRLGTCPRHRSTLPASFPFRGARQDRA